VAAPIDMRAGLAAGLKRLVRDPREYPMRDRRRFRNLLLDAVTSDAMPLAELLLQAHDDGLLKSFPDRSASRAQWDAVIARLASDLQTQRFVEPGVARFVADAWGGALGPEIAPMARVSIPRPVVAPRQPSRSAMSTSPRPAPPPSASSATSSSSMRAYRRSNRLFLLMALVFTVLVVLAFSQTGRKREVIAPVPTAMPEPIPLPTPAPLTPAPLAVQGEQALLSAQSATIPGTRDSANSQSNDTTARLSARVPVAAAPARTTDDIVLKAGRIFEGKVLSVRQQSVVVKDEETGLDFEINKLDIERIVTRDGRVLRFSDDNVPMLGDDEEITPMSHAGRYRVRYAERWGTERGVCGDLARRFAPGTELTVRHLRGAPMLKLEFVNGLGFNGAVRSDGLFESGASTAPVRGPGNSFVSVRLSGRFSRGGVLSGVARMNAITTDGALLCDLALTMGGEREP